MRSAGRVVFLALGLALGVRETGKPDSDTIPMELRTEVFMTGEGFSLVPVFLPVTAHPRRSCARETGDSRASMTGNEIIAAVANRAVECSLLDSAVGSNRISGNVH